MPQRRPILSADQRAFALAARRAILTTIRPDGRPRPLPVCFALLDPADADARDVERLDAVAPPGASGRDLLPLVFIPLDRKPKRVDDPHALARVRDLVARPAVSVLVDRWDEDWSRLGWLRLDGLARLVEPDADPDTRAHAIAALRARYPQYAAQALETRPLIRIEIDAAVAWGRLDAI